MKRLFVTWVIAFLCAIPVHAHQMNTAITRVLVNVRTGNIEIMHRFYLHDAEHALRKIAGRQVHLLDDTGAQQQFARYVSAHFALGLGQAMPAPLVPVGQEVEGKFIWVYQELPIPNHMPDLWFRFDALQDHWPEQVNQINVEGLGAVRSLRFTRDHTWQRLALHTKP